MDHGHRKEIDSLIYKSNLFGNQPAALKKYLFPLSDRFVNNDTE